jgi:SAM-dependent methyltransferase
MCLTDFSECLMSLPDPDYPALSRVLPRTPPESTQVGWVGSSGRLLLQDTLSFARIATARYERLSGNRLEGSRILDYGCGFGRLLRAMLYYSDPENLFGVDPWDQSIAACRDYNVLATVAQSDHLPRSLPVPGPFDLVYAYSVFTHLSERAAICALNVMRSVIKDRGIALITVWNGELWEQSGRTKTFLQPK